MVARLENGQERVSILGRRIEAIMALRGMRQADLARESGVPRQTIHSAMSGTTQQPDLTTLRKLAKALDVDLAALTSDVGFGNTLDFVTSAIEQDQNPPSAVGKSAEKYYYIAGISAAQDDTLRSIRINFGTQEDLILAPLFDLNAPPVTRESAPVRYTPITMRDDGHFLAVHVTDACMEPRILPGDVIYVNVDISPTLGDVVLVERDSTWKLSRLRSDDRGTRALIPDNPMFPPVMLGGDEDSKIVGVVVDVVTRKGKP